MRRLALCLTAALATIGCMQPVDAAPWANVAEPVFAHADTRELPDTYIDALAQDATGFVWVGTAGGLARYDGYRFRSFAPNPNDPNALPEGYVRTLLAGSQRRLWIGTSSSGLVAFDESTETFRTWRPDPSKGTGPRSASIVALAERDGKIWAGGDAGLDRFDPQSQRFEPIDVVPGAAQQPSAGSILFDAKGALWVGTAIGLFYRAPGGEHFSKISLGNDDRARGALVASLYQDGAGRIWVGCLDRIFVLDGARVIATLHASSAQVSMVETAPGIVWSAALAGGISIVDLTRATVRYIAADRINPGGFAQGPTTALMRDRSGLIWIATGDGGLLLFDPNSRGMRAISATNPATTLSFGGVTSLAMSRDGRLWAGGLDGAIAAIDATQGIAARVQLPARVQITSLATSPGGTMWIGTVTGLCRLDTQSAIARCATSPAPLGRIGIQAMFDDGRTLWLGTGAGLFAQDERSGAVTAYRRGSAPGGLSNGSVMSLYRDRKGRLWIGTFNGLNRLDPATHRIAQFTFDRRDPSSVGTGFIDAIVEDRSGRIWAGAVGGPLNVLQERGDGTAFVRHVDRAQGMPHQNVDGLRLAPDGQIWASTNAGLATIDPVTLRARPRGWIDGVLGGDYWSGSAATGPDGTLFFGSVDGISVVMPGARSTWSYQPPIVVTEFEAGAASVPAWTANAPGAVVELPATQRGFDAEFAALDYSAPRALRYAYKLDGFDRDWIETAAARRLAAYTNLPPGRYTLRVRATNRYGRWSGAQLALTIEALPAWYERWWFRALLAVLALLAIWAAIALRTGFLHQRQKELETLVASRTRALSVANARLEELSLTDPLTGLRNRRFLESFIESDTALTLRRYAESGTEYPPDADLLFVLVDIDRFKEVNDLHGHHAGDRVLVQMRERLLEVFRESDYVVRGGGEEFLMVARGGRRDEAAELAARVRKAVASRPFALGGGETARLSVSAGVAAFPFVQSAPGALTWSQTIDLADRALYAAKQSGRNASIAIAATPATRLDRIEGALESGDDVIAAAALALQTS